LSPHKNTVVEFMPFWLLLLIPFTSLFHHSYHHMAV